MICPTCGAPTKIVDTRTNGFIVIRRRVCTFNRAHYFNTREAWIDLSGESLAHYLRRMLHEMNDNDS